MNEKERYQRLGRRITSARNSKGMTLDDVAKRCNINREFVQSIEEGNVPAFIEQNVVLPMICEYLDLPLNVLPVNSAFIDATTSEVLIGLMRRFPKMQALLILMYEEPSFSKSVFELMREYEVNVF